MGQENEERISGINPEFIENKEEYKVIISDMTCPLCLNVICNPLECKKCQTLICADCYFILEVGEEKCIKQGCEGVYAKANKYVREFLGALTITCEACGKKGLKYADYIRHLDECEAYLSRPVNKTIKEIKEKDAQIEKLKAEIAKAKENLEASINNSTASSSGYQSTLSNEEIRKKLVTYSLSVQGKMELYNSCIYGKLNEFSNLIQNKHYPILEEISAKNFGWTSLHYAMHYGKWEIIKYILDNLRNSGKLELAMQLRSSDKRSPLLCLLRSNNLTNDQKKDIFIRTVQTYKIKITPDIQKELEGRNMLSILNSCKTR